MKKPHIDADIPPRLQGNTVFLMRRSHQRYVTGVYHFNDRPNSIRALERHLDGDSATEIKISGLIGDIAVKLGMYVVGKATTVQRITREELIKVLEGMMN